MSACLDIESNTTFLDEKSKSSGQISEKNFKTIEGLRGVAILLVMLIHSSLFQPVTTIDILWKTIAGFGWIGVDLFFVISGFLITGILLDSKHSTRYFRNFYARRFLRIFPIYYGFLFLYCFVAPTLPFLHIHTPHDYTQSPLSYWLYFANFSMAYYGKFENWDLAIFWTLAVEEQFYLLWPLVVWFFNIEKLTKICFYIMIFCLALRGMMMLFGVGWLPIYTLTPTRIDTLACGALAAILIRGNIKFSVLILYSRIILIFSGFCLLLLISWNKGLPFAAKSIQLFGFTLLAIFFSTLLVITVASNPKKIMAQFFVNPCLLILGRYSYAMYIFHCFFITRFFAIDFPLRSFPTFYESNLLSQCIFYIFVFGSTMLTAYISWHFYEKHFLKLKKHFPRQVQSVCTNETSFKEVKAVTI